ncbi:MAG TPA: hypothetical protein VF679_01305, partial [Pedobacter sp.]
HNSTPTATIPDLVEAVKKAEVPFKSAIRLLLDDASYSSFIDTEMQVRFEAYLTSDWKYFSNVGLYFQAEVDGLFAAMIDFSSVVFQRAWTEKRTLLELEAGLLEDTRQAIA